MKNAYDGLISGLDMTEERMSGLRICQQKLPKVKNKKKEECKNTELSSLELWGENKRYAV